MMKKERIYRGRTMDQIGNNYGMNINRTNGISRIKTFAPEAPAGGGDPASFSPKTIGYNTKKVMHRTSFGEYMNGLIGRHEINGKAPSDITKGNPGHQWCSYTVSFALEKSVGRDKLKKFGIDKTWPRVTQYVEWGKKNGRYKAIQKADVGANTIDKDRATRESQIRAQLKDPKKRMKEGDLIIWKGSYYAKTNVGNKQIQGSHIGMIERVTQDQKTGEYFVWVIEGNANEAKSDSKFERYINPNDSTIGAQKAGEIVEMNNNDGVIRKCYSVKELANFGYSGYIDMQGIVS